MNDFIVTHCGWRRWCNMTSIGVLCLIGALTVSLVRVLIIRQRLYATDKIIIRIAHWQLEVGYRDALDLVISNYNALHAADNVEVVQLAVTEQVYPQWLNTHLTSGTAPDLAEMGMAKLSNESDYILRFFTPLGDLIHQPNPYNKGTLLETVPWRDTFIDGLLGAYNTDLQDYFGVPVSFFTMRLFYNKDYLREATGHERPPRTLGELFEVCTQLRALGRRRGRTIIPIAGSKYSRDFFMDQFAVPFTAPLMEKLDWNGDGAIDTMETYAGYQRGDADFHAPELRGWFNCTRAVCDEFVKGFMAMDRDQAAFQFVQGDAAMIASGSWDAESLFRQARFPIGLIRMPLPGPGERWHKQIAGKGNEAQTKGGSTFGLYKLSRHREWAIDFMHFLTSMQWNQAFNRRVNWLPVVIGTTPRPELMPFMPDPEGFSARAEFRYADHTTTLYEGQLWLYLQGELTYEEFVLKLKDIFSDPVYGVDRVWAKYYDEAVRGERTRERLIAMLSTAALMDPVNGAASAKRLRQAIADQLFGNGGAGLRHRYEEQNHRSLPDIL